MAARIALVTGAARGVFIVHAEIGYAIAIRLAKDDLNIAINDIPAKRGTVDTVVVEIRALVENLLLSLQMNV
jgi:NAD(P)-dependent dehydrogenase (short-subunit alcohol dehydrogenase family)